MKALKSNSLKPNYHFFPITGWMNDPNGLIYWKGKYHMFYQYNPKKPKWGNIHWGHAVSDDLVHWKHLPIALYPKNETHSAFSGSAVEKDGRMILVYTYYRDPQYNIGEKEIQCIAASNDGINFKEYEKNPVIASPPEDGIYAFRDPKVRRSTDGRWEMVLGSGKDGIGRVLLYRSSDLINWRYEKTLFEYEQAKECECPDLVTMNGKDVLIFSGYTPEVLGSFYSLGKIEEGRLVEERSGMLDWGYDYYAAQTFFGANRTIVIAWMQNWLQSDSSSTQKEGWNGMMALPRELYIANNVLKVKPVKELEALRSGALIAERELTGKGSFDLEVEKNSYEVSYKSHGGFDLKLYNTENESVEITLNGNLLEVNTKNSGIVEGAKRRLNINERREENYLRVFVDSSSIEIFLNESVALSFRVYPRYVYNQLEFDGGTISILSAYTLKNIWL